jgi:hypothetical protein
MQTWILRLEVADLAESDWVTMEVAGASTATTVAPFLIAQFEKPRKSAIELGLGVLFGFPQVCPFVIGKRLRHHT